MLPAEAQRRKKSCARRREEIIAELVRLATAEAGGAASWAAVEGRELLGGMERAGGGRGAGGMRAYEDPRPEPVLAIWL